MYAVTQGIFRTPRGQTVALAYREDTNDYNTLNACLNEDEYNLRELSLEGTALDVGSYLGGVAIGLAIDNPDLRVVAIEPVPPNYDLLVENVERCGLAERVTCLKAAAGKGKTATIRWAFAGNEIADHHAFVGNSSIMGDEVTSLSEEVPARSLASLVKEYGPFSFAKVDCEGCEFPLLQGTALKDVALIRGEIHYNQPEEFTDALEPTHDLTLPAIFPGAFEAVRRG